MPLLRLLLLSTRIGQIIWILIRRYDVLCMICTVQIQPRRHVAGRAEYLASTRQHKLDQVCTDDEYTSSENM